MDYLIHLAKKKNPLIYDEEFSDVPVYKFYYLASMYVTEIVCTRVRPLEIY